MKTTICFGVFMGGADIEPGVFHVAVDPGSKTEPDDTNDDTHSEAPAESE